MTAYLLFKKASLLYLNIWPEQGRGYNSFESATERLEVFDRALEGVSAFRPDMILMACNIRKYSDIILNDPESVYGNLLPVMRDSDMRIAIVSFSEGGT